MDWLNSRWRACPGSLRVNCGSIIITSTALNLSPITMWLDYCSESNSSKLRLPAEFISLITNDATIAAPMYLTGKNDPLIFPCVRCKIGPLQPRLPNFLSCSLWPSANNPTYPYFRKPLVTSNAGRIIFCDHLLAPGSIAFGLPSNEPARCVIYVEHPGKIAYHLLLVGRLIWNKDKTRAPTSSHHIYHRKQRPKWKLPK